MSIESSDRKPRSPGEVSWPFCHSASEGLEVTNVIILCFLLLKKDESEPADGKGAADKEKKMKFGNWNTIVEEIHIDFRGVA